VRQHFGQILHAGATQKQGDCEDILEGSQTPTSCRNLLTSPLVFTNDQCETTPSQEVQSCPQPNQTTKWQSLSAWFAYWKNACDCRVLSLARWQRVVRARSYSPASPIGSIEAQRSGFVETGRRKRHEDRYGTSNGRVDEFAGCALGAIPSLNPSAGHRNQREGEGECSVTIRRHSRRLVTGQKTSRSETRVRTSQPKRIFCPCLSFTQLRADLVHVHESRSVTNLFRIEWNKLPARQFSHLEELLMEVKSLHLLSQKTYTV
jgi:hypothetical protein